MNIKSVMSWSIWNLTEYFSFDFSHFQGLPENVTENIIGQAIKHGLKDLCNQPIRTPDSQVVVSSCLHLRHDVDTVAALIENFQLGMVYTLVRKLKIQAGVSKYTSI